MPVESQCSGRWAEQQALQQLEAKGWRLLDRNWRCRWGELDLVLEQHQQLLLVEGKRASHRSLGPPRPGCVLSRQKAPHGACDQLLESCASNLRREAAADQAGSCAVDAIPRNDLLDGCGAAVLMHS